MSVEKVDIGSMDRVAFGTILRPFIDAFNPDDGGGIDCDLKVFGHEGDDSFFFYDHSENKAFLQRTTTEEDPGRLMYIQALTSAVSAGHSSQGLQIRSRATGTGLTLTGGTDGAEIGAGWMANSDSGTLALARGIIGSIAGKNAIITIGTAILATIDLNVGSIGTAHGFRSFINNSGTITNSYAFIAETANVLYPWKYGLYIASGQATYPIDVTQNVLAATGDTAAVNIIVTSGIERVSGRLRGLNVNLTPLTAVNSYFTTGARINIDGLGAESQNVRGMMVGVDGFTAGMGDLWGIYVYIDPGANPSGSSAVLRLEVGSATGSWVDAFILTAAGVGGGPASFLEHMSGDFDGGGHTGTLSNQHGWLKVKWATYTKYIPMYDTLTP